MANRIFYYFILRKRLLLIIVILLLVSVLIIIKLFLSGKLTVSQYSKKTYTELVENNLLITERESLLKAREEFNKDSEKLIQRASDYIHSNIDSVVQDPIIPPSGNVHDYISLAPLFWPKKSDKNKIDYEQIDAKVNPERFKYIDEDNFYTLSDKVYLLALASYIFENNSFAEKTKEFLSVWFLDENTKMNPNFEFAQFVPDKNMGTGAAMDGKKLAFILDAVMLLKNNLIFSASEEEKLNQWFSYLYLWAKKSQTQLDECQENNNHGTWCDVFYLTLALYNKDYNYANFIINQTKSRIGKHFTLEGSQPNEMSRVDSLHYHIFNLEGYVRLAQMAQKLEIDLWQFKTSDGINIKKGIDYLIPYLLDEKVWLGQQLTDRESKTNLENEIINLYQKAYYYYKDPQYLEILRDFDYAKKENYLNNILYPI